MIWVSDGEPSERRKEMFSENTRGEGSLWLGNSLWFFVGGMVTLPETNRIISPEMDDWNTWPSFWDGPFVAAMLVLGRVSDPFNQKVKWPPTKESKGHFESPCDVRFLCHSQKVVSLRIERLKESKIRRLSRFSFCTLNINLEYRYRSMQAPSFTWHLYSLAYCISAIIPMFFRKKHLVRYGHIGPSWPAASGSPVSGCSTWRWFHCLRGHSIDAFAVANASWT